MRRWMFIGLCSVILFVTSCTTQKEQLTEEETDRLLALEAAYGLLKEEYETLNNYHETLLASYMEINAVLEKNFLQVVDGDLEPMNINYRDEFGLESQERAEVLEHEVNELLQSLHVVSSEARDLRHLRDFLYPFYDTVTDLYGLKDVDREIVAPANYEWVNDAVHPWASALLKDDVFYHITSEGTIEPIIPEAFETTYCYPRDETEEDESFATFIEDYKKAIEEKDLSFVKEHMDERIKLGFGGFDGIENFDVVWGMEDNVETSSFWDEMDMLLSLGFVKEYYEEFGYTGGFVGPYTFVDFPETGDPDTYDPFFFVAAMYEKTPIYRMPWEGSGLIAEVDYEVMQLANPMHHEWYMVNLSDGRLGWAHGDTIRQPIDLRAKFSNIDGVWTLIYLLTGD